MEPVQAEQLLFSEKEPLVYLNNYQKFAVQTDQNRGTGLSGLRLPLLGLFGEVGSLVSELKKKQRDPDSYIGYKSLVVEEFGDTLWYFANIASRAGLNLSVLAQRVFREIDDWDEVESDNFGTFGDIQSKRRFFGPLTTQKFEVGVMDLAGKIGLLLNDFSLGKIANNRDLLSSHLVEIFRALIAAADGADISLEESAQRNLIKIFNRWPQKQTYGLLFDDAFETGEQLPREIVMRFTEKKSGGKVYVIQQCKGINIGDRLTDNKVEEDDYRFHDVFHLAYAAILGWSPVVRSLFKVKRKSDPKIDETQDGARAILIEEGISTWVFNHGLRLNSFESVKTVDYALLRSIRDFVRGYEVEQCPLWQWEKAILDGFKMFRALRKYRKGQITADLNKHSISFKVIK
jgi:NTP pyrophosphatase (non-canonical NTP hydrolase)